MNGVDVTGCLRGVGVRGDVRYARGAALNLLHRSYTPALEPTGFVHEQANAGRAPFVLKRFCRIFFDLAKLHAFYFKMLYYDFKYDFLMFTRFKINNNRKIM